MKNNTFQTKSLAFLIAIIISSSCQLNESVNKDLKTGAYSRGEGIGVKDIVIMANGENVNSNEFEFGSRVNIMFQYVSGLNKSDGKAYPELSVQIVKNDKDTMISISNILTNSNNGIDSTPLQLTASFNAALPNQHGEKYKLFAEISDKKGDGKFSYELPFTVKKYDLFNIQSNGIDYSTIYLWDETLQQIVFDPYLHAEHLYYIILDGLEGLDVNHNGRIFPIFTVDITGNNGLKLFSNPNLLSSHDLIGVSPQELKDRLTAKLKFKKGQFYNPYKLTALIKDKNSPKMMTISTELNIN